MKLFEIELRRTSYVTIRIKAETADEAEELAWEELASEGYYEGHANWDVEAILETEEDEA